MYSSYPGCPINIPFSHLCLVIILVAPLKFLSFMYSFYPCCHINISLTFMYSSYPGCPINIPLIYA